MMADLEQILAELHEGIAKGLLKKVIAGEATAAELSVARQFLKDNNVTAVPAKGTPLGDLADQFGDLPDFSDEDNVVSLGGKPR
jgi:hypothetical protein